MKSNKPRKINGTPKKQDRKKFILDIIDRYNGVVNWHASGKVNRNTLYSRLGMAVREKDFKELAKEGVIKSVPSGSGRRKLWVRNGEKPIPPPAPEPVTPYKLRKQALKEFYEVNPHLRRR